MYLWNTTGFITEGNRQTLQIILLLWDMTNIMPDRMKDRLLRLDLSRKVLLIRYKRFLILGAPFFTRVWAEKPKEATDDVEAAAEGYVPYELSSHAVSMGEAWNMALVNGIEPAWSEEDGQYYAEYIKDGITYKIWLEDQRSMELKLQAAKDNGLAGISFWKLGLEDAGMWDTVLKYMN